MPGFHPFPGLRYALGVAPIDLVTAPPYDVIDAAERNALAARHPNNVVAIDLPVDGADPYATAAETYAAWQRDGVLVTDPPSFYGYRMRTPDGRHTTGVFGALELSAPGEGGILPHEQTTPKAKTDRLDLTRATHANLSAVWGLSPAAGLTALVAAGPDDDVTSWLDGDGVEHSLWVIADEGRQKAIADAVADQPVVIADGHHRYEIALTHRTETGATGQIDGAGAVLTYVVELAEDELTVLPIHRLIGELPDGFDLAGALASHFEVAPAGTAYLAGDAAVDTLVERGTLCLVTPDGDFELTPRPDAFAGVRDLDTSRLDAALAQLPPHDLVYQHGVDHIRRRVADGEFAAGVLIRPCPVARILEIAHGGERMPPKTTFFSPKPRTGVVFRSFASPADAPAPNGR